MRLLIAVLALVGSIGAAQAQAQEDRWTVYRNSDGFLTAGIAKGEARLELLCADPQTYTLFYSFPEADLHSSLAEREQVMLTERIASGSYIGIVTSLDRGEGRAIVGVWLQPESGMLQNLGRAPRTISMAVRISDSTPERNTTVFTARGSTDAMASFTQQCADPSPGPATGVWELNAQGSSIIYTHPNGAMLGIACRALGKELFYTLPQIDLDSALWSAKKAQIVVAFVGAAPIILNEALSIPFEDKVAFARPLEPANVVYERMAAGKGVVEVSLSVDGTTFLNTLRVPLDGIAETLPALLALPTCGH